MADDMNAANPNTITITATDDYLPDPPKPIATSMPDGTMMQAAIIVPADSRNNTYFNFDSPPPAKRSRRSSSSINPFDIDPDCSNASTATSATTNDSSVSATASASVLDGSNYTSASSASGNASTAAAPKRRGRPPKAHSTPISPSQLLNMSETDVRYFQMRDKNNEASRRSRLNRKDREQQFSEEAADLEATNRRLVELERRLEAQCSRWKKRVLQLATV